MSKRMTRISTRANCFMLGILVIVLAGCDQRLGAPPRPGERAEAADNSLMELLPTAPDSNILVISFDALRADALGVYGHGKEISPNIDAFGEESLIFDRAYTAAPVTPTSFAASFTGLYPFKVFLGWQFEANNTLASKFSEAGYTTGAFLNNVQLTAERHFDQGFDRYVVDPVQNLSDEEILDAALAWLVGHKDDRFFLWVHFINPHAPYDYRDLAARFYDPTYTGEFEETTGGTFQTEDEQDLERIRSLYVGEVHYIDHLFGQMITGVKRLGLLDNTVIVLTTDHGEEFKERGVFQHEHLTEETIRIPLMIFHPAVRKAARSQAPVSNIDLYPTLAGLAGLPLEATVDGVDIRTGISTEREIATFAMTSGKYRAASLLKGRYKLILECLPEKRALLYDLESDPRERKNLMDDQHRVASNLARELQKVVGGDPCRALDRAIAGKSPTEGISDDTVQALEALGYVGD